MELFVTELAHTGGTKSYHMMELPNSDGSCFLVRRFGKINTFGQINTTHFSSSDYARQEVLKIISTKEKTKNNGYYLTKVKHQHVFLEPSDFYDHSMIANEIFDNSKISEKAWLKSPRIFSSITKNLESWELKTVATAVDEFSKQSNTHWPETSGAW